MHIRGDKSDIFRSEYCQSDIFGSKENRNYVYDIFYTNLVGKHRLTDISWFTRGNPDFRLHYFGIFYVNVQVSKYKMSWIAMKLK